MAWWRKNKILCELIFFISGYKVLCGMSHAAWPEWASTQFIRFCMRWPFSDNCSCLLTFSKSCFDLFTSSLSWKFSLTRIFNSISRSSCCCFAETDGAFHLGRSDSWQIQSKITLVAPFLYGKVVPLAFPTVDNVSIATFGCPAFLAALWWFLTACRAQWRRVRVLNDKMLHQN